MAKVLNLDILQDTTNNSQNSIKNVVKTFPTNISTLFLPLVKYFRCIGMCPFTIKQNGSYVEYEFKWKSFSTFYYIFANTSFLIGSFIFFITLLMYGFKTEYKELLQLQGLHMKNGSYSDAVVSEFGTRLIPATFPLFSLSASIGLIQAMPHFLKILKKWQEFQIEYVTAFPYRIDDPWTTLLQNFRTFYFKAFPIVGLGAVIVVVAVMYDCESWKGCIFPKEFGCIPAIWASFAMLIMVGSHAVHFLLLNSLKQAFTQICKGIQLWNEKQFSLQHCQKERTGNYRNYLNENIKKWETVILFAKKQVDTTGKAIGFHQTFLIVINFIYLCVGVFSAFLTSKLAEGNSNRGSILLLFSCWGFSLLIIKAFACERIVEEEKLIVEQLRKVNVKEYLPAIVKINGLIDLISRSPAEIRFWNVITLNKSFLLQLLGQVATYLIVLIQFENIQRER